MKVRNWHFLSADFGVLVGLTTKWFSEEMLISNMHAWFHVLSDQKILKGIYCTYIWESDAPIISFLDNRGRTWGVNFLFLLPRTCSIKVRIFWEGQTIWKNLPLKIWRYRVVSKFKWKIFFKFCGLLRISKLWLTSTNNMEVSTIVHSGGVGGQNWVKYGPCSCWMTPWGS